MPQIQCTDKIVNVPMLTDEQSDASWAGRASDAMIHRSARSDESTATPCNDGDPEGAQVRRKGRQKRAMENMQEICLTSTTCMVTMRRSRPPPTLEQQCQPRPETCFRTSEGSENKFHRVFFFLFERHRDVAHVAAVLSSVSLDGASDCHVCLSLNTCKNTEEWTTSPERP